MSKPMPKGRILLIVIILSSLILGFLFNDIIFPRRSAYDKADKPNDKMIPMFNAAIEREIDDHTQSDAHPGYIPGSRQRSIDYLKTIKYIEGYARYGVESTRPHNYLELKIGFADGKIAEEVYTGQSVSPLVGIAVLMKVEIDNGKVVKVYTNGQEKKGSPEWVIPDINTMINKAIAYDIDQHHDKYFPPQKTSKDFEQEWEKQ